MAMYKTVLVHPLAAYLSAPGVHARLRELMPGGVPATVMRGLRVPALFSH